MLTFQQLIASLNNYWQNNGCSILQPYVSEMGAATLHPVTALRAIDKNLYKIAYVQPSIRPSDGRYAKNPNRLYQHHQYQVLLKPSPDNIQKLYLESLVYIGIDLSLNDVRFINDDWENHSIGAAGAGWEIWLNGVEISQFTYMQQVGGIQCGLIPGELAYGLERLCMILQKKNNVFDLMWSESMTYGELFRKQEEDFSKATFCHNNYQSLIDQFTETEKKAILLIENNLPVAAYDQCLKASHVLNLLDAIGTLGVQERTNFILKTREIANKCCELWLKFQESL